MVGGGLPPPPPPAPRPNIPCSRQAKRKEESPQYRIAPHPPRRTAITQPSANHPLEHNPWLRALIILGVAIAAIYLWGQVWAVGARFADTIVVLFTAWIIAFLLSPMVRLLMRWRAMPRAVAGTIVYIAMVAAVVVPSIFIIPPTVQQVADLGDEIPGWTDRLDGYIDDAQDWLDRRGIDANLREFYQGEEVKARGQELGQELAGRAVDVAQSVLVVALYFVLILIIGFYFLLDGPNIIRGAIEITPPRFRADVRWVIERIDNSFGGYVRAWAILGAIYGGGTAIIMALTDIPFILPFSVFAGFMLIIPFIGDIVAVVPPIAVGLLTTPLRNVVIALIALIALQQLVLQILRPKIMGSSVGLHPVLVLVAFLVGARASGIWGALLAVPIAGVLQSVLSLFYTRYVLDPAARSLSPAAATAYAETNQGGADSARGGPPSEGS